MQKKNLNDKINIIICRLQKEYGEPECALNFRTPFELLIAVILSAQCTDKRVNIVTEKLFARASKPQEIAAMEPDELISYIRPCGFFNNKAKNILSAAKDISEKYGGEVPREREELVLLAGVGNKTASVVYAVAFGGQAVPVDTHVGRVSNRLGLTKSKNPDIIQRELESSTDEEKRTLFHHLLITHGRQICKSRKPDCGNCAVKGECDYYKKI